MLACSRPRQTHDVPPREGSWHGGRRRRPCSGGLPAASRTALRGPTVRRLLTLRAGKELTAGHVRVAADALGMSERTVWRWLAAAENDEAAAADPGARSRADTRFTITPEVRGLLALWKGNVRAVHRELVLRAARQSPPADAPSLTTLHRAIRRDLTPGERAGLAGGERRHASTMCSWPGRGAGVTMCGDRPRPGAGAGRCRRQGAQAVDHVVHRLRDERDHWCRGHAGASVAGVGAGRAALRSTARGPLRSVRWSAREGAGGPWQGFPVQDGDRAFDLLDVTVEDLPLTPRTSRARSRA
nr:helix-turn-helix domain-containing protein [Streptomyces sp. LBUM 1481]